MGWSPDMDIEKTFRLFERSTRETVSVWGMVTPIRVQNIEVSSINTLIRVQNIEI
jgi:hypothetical protein